jgi:hypothetical protein
MRQGATLRRRSGLLGRHLRLQRQHLSERLLRWRRLLRARRRILRQQRWHLHRLRSDHRRRLLESRQLSVR